MLWFLAHQVLPIRMSLKRWGMNIPTKCPYCNENEDLNHAFILCRGARALWQDLQQLIDALAGQRVPINIATLTFGHNIPRDIPRYELKRYVITATASALWSTRNKRVLNATSKEGNLTARVIANIKAHIELDELVAPMRIANFWTYGRVLCSYEQNVIQFNI